MKKWFISVLLVLLASLSISARDAKPVEKTITVKVTETDECYIDGVKIGFWDLPTELNKRLWRSFVGNDKMPDAIALVYEGNVSAETQKATLTSIKEAQRRTLIQYCIFKYKKKYEDLPAGKQDKVKSRFPVLFQTAYTGQ